MDTEQENINEETVNIPEDPGAEDFVPAQPAGWRRGDAETNETVMIETGRNTTMEAHVGDNFVVACDRVGEAAGYGGYWKVYLNGNEVLNPDDAPELIESGMRIALTPYDKVG